MSTPRLITIIILGVLLWGTFHAVGASIGGFGEQKLVTDFRRAIVVLGATLLFVGFWVAMLTHRNRRLSRRDDTFTIDA
jgi:hypothetical protein